MALKSRSGRAKEKAMLLYVSTAHQAKTVTAGPSGNMGSG